MNERHKNIIPRMAARCPDPDVSMEVEDVENFGLIAALLAIGVLAVATNAFVAATVCCNGHLRAPLDRAIASLAVIDAITGAVGIPVIVLLYKSGMHLTGKCMEAQVKLLSRVSAFPAPRLLGVQAALGLP